MPELDLFPVPLYNPAHPYHWEYDNLPLQSLKLRDEIINGQVDYNSTILMNAAGNQGTVAVRLAKSMNPDGTLIPTAIDDTEHNIAEHTDGTTTLTGDEIAALLTQGYVVSNPVPYVRMLAAERSKLSLIAPDATNMTVQVQTPSNIVLYTEGPITLQPSSTVTWQVSGNHISANMAFPPAAAHRHYYDITPVTTDYKNFKVTSVNTPYMAGSLRVYINGTRISDGINIYAPGHLPSLPWTLNSFTPHEDMGTFVLLNAVTSLDSVQIDFDVALA